MTKGKRERRREKDAEMDIDKEEVIKERERQIKRGKE